MRYSAICLSMLTDRIEDLECQRVDAVKRMANRGLVIDKVLKRRDELHLKVRD